MIGAIERLVDKCEIDKLVVKVGMDKNLLRWNCILMNERKGA
jgi:hypothetical protein